MKIRKLRYPIAATLWHDESVAIVGGTIANEHNGLQRYHHMNYHRNPADGDTFVQDFYLERGNYDLYLLGVRIGDQAKLDLYIDNVLKVSGIDFYSGPPVYNWENISPSVSVGHSGQHTLKGVINGRTAPSTSWRTRITKFWFVKV
jgi:hypothetical protein